jgi:hypothetical protein
MYIPHDAVMKGKSMEMQTIVVPLGRNGKYGTLTCDCTKFNETVQKHVWEYGLRQCLNDAIASKEDDDGVKLTNEQLVAKADETPATRCIRANCARCGRWNRPIRSRPKRIGWPGTRS